jgi:succinyl-CoA synthetase beta subunit
MNIHEYQAKRILKKYDVKVLNGFHVSSYEEIEKKARKIETDIAVVKAQIHAGGRGKAGGVKLVKSMTEAINESNALLGKTLVTHQTGPEGAVVRQLYIEEGCNIQKEYYLSIVLDRATSQIAIIASQEGGIDIEEVANKTPDKITTVRIDPYLGLADYQIREIINTFNLPIEAHKDMQKTLRGMYKCYIEKDCNMIEINPLVLTSENEIVALDAKMNFDDNAMFRQSEVAELRDIYEEDPKEVEASKFDLSYIALDGTIGCMVNGAGLAMATMDSIKNAGGSPANFLDIGGGATTENVKNAFRIILSDAGVKGIFVNIFGGIMKCDVVAKGIIKATEETLLQVPIVVRLEGTNEYEGKEILNSSGLNIHTADNMDEGGKMIVELSKKGVI